MNTSLAALALTQEEAFHSRPTDSYLKKAGNFSVGTAITTTAFVGAVLETALFAIAAAVSYPVSFIAPKRYAKITTRVNDSANTVVEAAKRTFGAEIKKAQTPATPKKIEPSRVEKLKVMAREKATAALQFGKAHKKEALIAGAITASVLSAYFLGLFGYAYNLAFPADLAPCNDHEYIASKAAAVKAPNATAEKTAGIAEQALRTIGGVVVGTVALAFGVVFGIGSLNE